MAIICFELVHGTSVSCAAVIQKTAFTLSECGYWGPAVYFYDFSSNGIDNAKKWLDKKIQKQHIPHKALSAILIACASCDDLDFLDGTREKFRASMREVEKKARTLAYARAEEAFRLTGVHTSRHSIDRNINRMRNAHIERIEKIANRRFKIFRAFLKNEVCITIRDISCLSIKPYKEIPYE